MLNVESQFHSGTGDNFLLSSCMDGIFWVNGGYCLKIQKKKPVFPPAEGLFHGKYVGNKIIFFSAP